MKIINTINTRNDNATDVATSLRDVAIESYRQIHLRILFPQPISHRTRISHTLVAPFDPGFAAMAMEMDRHIWNLQSYFIMIHIAAWRRLSFINSMLFIQLIELNKRNLTNCLRWRTAKIAMFAGVLKDWFVMRSTVNGSIVYFQFYLSFKQTLKVYYQYLNRLLIHKIEYPLTDYIYWLDWFMK